jgi:glycosyltransferase involved in cell wall biosynthesis
VTVIAQPPSRAKLRERLRRFLASGDWRHQRDDRTHFEGTKALLVVLDEPGPITDKDVPDGDVVIATWWTTAEFIRDLSSSKGEKVYFLQHYEVHDYLPIERVKETWRLPFKKIVVSNWLKHIAADEFGDRSAVVVPNGIDLKRFQAEPRGRQPRPTVGLLYSTPSYKGADIALRAIDLARRCLPSLRLVAFGATKPIKTLPLPGNTQFYFRPAQDRLRDIYGQCDAWLFASRTEGFGLPILEAMACRTPVIGTPSGAAPELLADGCGILVPQDDPAAMAEAILRIFEMSEDEWSGLSAAAYAEASRHDIAIACESFERALKDMLDTETKAPNRCP